MIADLAPRKTDDEGGGGKPADGLPMPRYALAIAAISLGTILTIIDGQIAVIALPTIARDLKVPNSSAVMVVTVYQLILVMTLLPFSALGSRIGLKRMYQGGQIVFALATTLCFFAKTLPLLLVARAFQSLGAAAALSVMSALVRSIYKPSHLGRGLALNTMFATTASAAAPVVGGAILGFASWPWLFAIGVPFALFSLALGRVGLPDVPARSARYDTLGALYCILTFGLVISGMETGVHGAAPLLAGAMVLAGLVSGVFLVRHELDEVNPVMPIDLLRQPVIALSCAGAMCAFVGSMLFLLSLPFRLQHGYGISPPRIGAMMAAWPLTMMIVAPLSGALSDKIPAGILGTLGMAIATVALLLLAFLPAHPSYADISWRMALCGAGFGLYTSPNVRLIIGSAPRERTASAGGLTSTTRLIGQTLGATLVATLLAYGLGEGSAPAFIACALALVAGALSLARLNPALRRPDAHEVESGGA
jgi:DHA2 family multidrug resistance protein-like MFS transporter